LLDCRVIIFIVQNLRWWIRSYFDVFSNRSRNVNNNAIIFGFLSKKNFNDVLQRW